MCNMLEDLLMHYGPHDGLSCGVGFVEERVEVRQQRVADVQVMFGALHQGGLGAVRSWILGLKTERWMRSEGWTSEEEGGAEKVTICLRCVFGCVCGSVELFF